jgi:hypothetical protein
MEQEDLGRGGNRAWGRNFLASTAVLVGLLVGYLVPRHLVPNGVSQYPAGTVERQVAEDARFLGATVGRRALVPRPLFPVLPVVRVDGVRREPGSCTEYPPGSVRNADYTARVTVYTLFAIPASRVRVTCGGAFY